MGLGVRGGIGAATQIQGPGLRMVFKAMRLAEIIQVRAVQRGHGPRAAIEIYVH